MRLGLAILCAAGWTQVVTGCQVDRTVGRRASDGDADADADTESDPDDDEPPDFWRNLGEECAFCGCPCAEWGPVPGTWFGSWSGELDGVYVSGDASFELTASCVGDYWIDFYGVLESGGEIIDHVFLSSLDPLGCTGNVSGNIYMDALQASREILLLGDFDPWRGFDGTWRSTTGGSGSFWASRDELQ